MDNRRKLIVALGAGALATPLTIFAQSREGKVWRVGFLAFRGRPDSLETDPFGGFTRGMREFGYIEGKNLEIEWRYAESKSERLPGLVAELLQRKVDVIVAAGTPVIHVVRKATTTIPIVMTTADDPVGAGFVQSLARPGGNITGLTILAKELDPKRLEMLLSMVPKLSRVAVLVNPSNRANIKNLETAGQKLGVKVLVANARTPQEIDSAFSLMHQQNVGALIVLLDPLFQQQKAQIAELAAKNRLPSMTADPIYVEAGCLMSYGSSLIYTFSRVATYVDKILKGAKPGELPVEQPTTFDMVVNLKTAKTLGIKIPNSVLVQATRVID